MARKKRSGDIIVKVFRSGATGIEVALNGDRTVEAAIGAAKLAKKDAEIVQVNGTEIDDLSVELEDGDRIVLVKNVEGGSR